MEGCREFCITVLLLACAVAFCRGNVLLTATSPEVEEHSQLNLTCRNLPASTTGVTWKRDQVDVVSSEPRVKVEFVSAAKEGRLTIATVEHEDEGTYTCTASGGQTSNTLQISVTHHIHPVTTARTTVSFPLGSHLELSCQADIHTDVIWFKEMTQLESGKGDVNITVANDDANHHKISTLMVANGNDHSGKYTCQNDHEKNHPHNHDHEHEGGVDTDKAVITVKIGADNMLNSAVIRQVSLSSVALMFAAIGSLLVRYAA